VPFGSANDRFGRHDGHPHHNFPIASVVFRTWLERIAFRFLHLFNLLAMQTITRNLRWDIISDRRSKPKKPALHKQEHGLPRWTLTCLGELFARLDHIPAVAAKHLGRLSQVAGPDYRATPDVGASLPFEEMIVNNGGYVRPWMITSTR
jgi:hypothetical protein